MCIMRPLTQIEGNRRDFVTHGTHAHTRAEPASGKRSKGTGGAEEEGHRKTNSLCSGMSQVQSQQNKE